MPENVFEWLGGVPVIYIINLHMVCHGQRATTEVATQNWKGGDTIVSLPARTGIAIKEAYNGRVPGVNSVEEGSGEEG